MNCGAYPNFVISPTGRRGIGVVQPESGIDYPLVNPSADIRNLIADLVLVLDAPYDEDWRLAQKAPFHIQSLIGLGCIGSTGQQPAVVIANNAGEVVFDSSAPPALKNTQRFFSKPLGEDYVFYSWYSKWSYCKIIAYRSWVETDADKKHYPATLTPQAAVLDGRAVTIRPRTIKKLAVLWPERLCEPAQRLDVFEALTDTNIKLKNGHNIEMTLDKQRALTGVTAQITIAASPGTGIGKYNGCAGRDDFSTILYDPAAIEPAEEEPPLPPPPIVSLNGVRTNAGDALLLLKDCLWLKKNAEIDCKRIEAEPPVQEEAVDPCAPPPPPPTPPELPCDEDENGNRIKAVKLLNPNIYGHVKIGADCTPCCECKDYEEAALKMNAYASQYKLIGQRAITAKDVYEQNVQKWRDVQSCSFNNPLRLFFVPQRCPYMDIVMIVCNPCDKTCLDVKQLILTLTNTEDAVAIFQPGYTAMFSSEINGRPVPVDTTVPNRFVVNFAQLKPGESAYVRFRVKFSKKKEYAISGTLIGLLTDDTRIVTDCNEEDAEYISSEQTIVASRSLSVPPEPDSEVEENIDEDVTVILDAYKLIHDIPYTPPGENEFYVFEIVPNSGDWDQVTIDSTGYIRFIDTPDFEDKTSYNFNVHFERWIVNEESGAVKIADITLPALVNLIDVNDNTPYIVSSAIGYVEDGAPIGTPVYRVVVADADGTGVRRGTIFELDRVGDWALFSVDQQGVVYMQATPELNKKQTYTFSVRAKNTTALLSSAISVTVFVKSKADAFLNFLGTTNVETAPPRAGNVITQVAVMYSDGTPPAAAQFAIKQGAADDANFVQINKNTGEITFKEDAPATSKKINYTFVVQARARKPAAAVAQQALQCDANGKTTLP